MAQLNARTDSFITLLLDVSGRARPGDLTAMGPDEAAAVLQAYADAHPERGLVFDGESLVPAPAPAPAPIPVTQAQVASADSDGLSAVGAPPAQVAGTEPAPAAWADYGTHGMAQPSGDPVWEEPGVAQPAHVESPYDAPSPVEPAFAPSVPEHELLTQPSAVPEHEMFPGAPAGFDAGAATQSPDPLGMPQGSTVPGGPAMESEFSGGEYGVPMAPGVGGYYGVADQPLPEYSDAAKAGEYQGDEVFAAQPAAPGPESSPQQVGYSSAAMPWWWWVIAIVFYPLGGIVGYFVVRRTDPRGARKLLILTLVIFVLGILAAAAIFFFGFAALGALLPAGTAP